MRSIVDVKKAEQKATELYEKIFDEGLNIILGDYHTKISEITDSLGIDVIETDLVKEFKGNTEMLKKIEIDKVVGIFVKSENTIIINKKDSIERQRFTIAHEIGHHVLGHLNDDVNYAYRDKITKGGKDPKERAANAFAAELLMPKKLVLYLYRNYRTKLSVRIYAELFGVSEQAMRIRLNGMLRDLRDA